MVLVLPLRQSWPVAHSSAVLLLLSTVLCRVAHGRYSTAFLPRPSVGCYNYRRSRSTKIKNGGLRLYFNVNNINDQPPDFSSASKGVEGGGDDDFYAQKLQEVERAIAQAKEERRKLKVEMEAQQEMSQQQQRQEKLLQKQQELLREQQLLLEEMARKDELQQKQQKDVYDVFNATDIIAPWMPLTVGDLDQPRKLKLPPEMQAISPKQTNLPTRSKLSHSDAGSLVIEFTPEGITSGTIISGAFSVAWFSAILPATLAGGFLGAVFMLPFWAAGSMVAKTAVVDPFVSSMLLIGQYAWSVETTLANAFSTNKQQGATENLRGAKVELSVVVNNVPNYELLLYGDQGLVVKLGLGLPEEELQTVAQEINDFLERNRDNNDLFERGIPELLSA